EAAFPTGKATAAAVQRGIDQNECHEVDLGGKHSSGSMVANDVDAAESYLLKPNAGGTSSAAGVSQETATQARREGASYQVAKLIGLEHYIPRVDVLTIDGKEWAAIHLLDYRWKNCERLLKDDPNAVQAVFERFAKTGVLWM